VTLIEDPRDVVRLQRLADIGRELRAALQGSQGHPGTINISTPGSEPTWKLSKRRLVPRCGRLVLDSLVGSLVVELSLKGIEPGLLCPNRVRRWTERFLL
jgi:hypothetical protein